ncbi:unnamed protein product [Rotaria sordida]|uniref:Uncharacterized protein n=1 Tax=Rotaria sordida TaxID=392033 RepID=A0A818SSE4_9BILA|nr:unnamed protein product [Rotaria sordida]
MAPSCDIISVFSLFQLQNLFSTSPKIIFKDDDDSSSTSSLAAVKISTQVELNLLLESSDFNRVRHCILPEQVISLRLSDDNNTLVQSDIFLSYFRIEQFTQLRSLTLVQIEFESLKSIFSNLNKLGQLRSLSFNMESVRYKFPARNDDYSKKFNQLKYFLSNSYEQILPQLNRLSLNSSTELISKSLPHLRQLKLGKCFVNELETIFQNSPQLQSLDISFDMNILNTTIILPSNQLIWLNLEIKTNIKDDIADGNFWQVLVRSLKTFSFQFYVSHIDIQKTLDSFSTSFWLEEKHWYIAYQNGYLFSLLYFAPVHIDSRNLSQFHSTAPNNSLIYEQLNKFTVNSFHINNNHYLAHIKTLALELSISLKRLQSVIDLNQIEHLIVPSLDHLLVFIPLEYNMPQLHELTIKNSVTIDTVDRLSHYRFERIRTLHIRVNDENIDCIIEELFYLFPHIAHLTFTPRIKSLTLMLHLLKGFKYLSNASFSADCSFFRKEANFCRNPKSVIQHFRQHTNDNISCRVYYLINTQLPFSIHWNIEEQVSIYQALNIDC